jgi:DNA-binding winged helix-turn-helix (wHTH) protein
MGAPTGFNDDRVRPLTLLIERRGYTLSREALLSNVLKYENPIITRTIGTHIRRLRAKFGSKVIDRDEKLIRASQRRGRSGQESFVLIIKEKSRRDARVLDIERPDGHRTKIRRFGNSVCEAFGIGV